MTKEKLQNMRNADPFAPFTIQMASGNSYRVPHRDYLSIHPTGRIAHVYLPKGGASTIDVMLITELVEDPAPSPPLESGV